MKKLLFLFIAGTFLLTSCGGDDDDAIPEGSFNVEAKIDGANWSGAGNTVVTVAVGQTLTAIGAGNPDRSTIALPFTGASTGTYDMANFATYINSSQTVFTASSGTLMVTEFTETSISGTFSFTATDRLGSGGTVEITSGKFTNVNVMR